MKNKFTIYRQLLLLLLGFGLGVSPSFAHHVLGRPAYSLNEDSNTPPSAVIETQVGEYMISYMVFPAFPRPHEPGRVNLYASHLATGIPYNGEVRFITKPDSWFDNHETLLGVQAIDDGVFRQGFTFDDKGDYIISALFTANGESYSIDFPLRVGDPVPIGPLGILAAALGVVLVGFSLWRRKKLIKDKVIEANRQPS